MSCCLLDGALALLGGSEHRFLVVTGPIGVGKSRAVAQLAEALCARGFSVGGIVAPRMMRAGLTVGYRAVDLATGSAVPLAKLEPPGTPAGRFYLDAEGLRFADVAVRQAIRSADIVILDEVGPAELAGGGHAPALLALVASSLPAVVVVRRGLVEQATDAFGLRGRTVDVSAPPAAGGPGRPAMASPDDSPEPLIGRA